MRNRYRATLVALLFAGGFASCARPIKIRPPSEPTTPVSAEVRAVIELVNAHRKRIGCPALGWVSKVATVAQAHSDDMVRRNFFNHRNPDGLSPFDRLEKAGLRFTKAAENIASGQRTGAAVFKSWITSAGHRRNIEDCELREHGIGFSAGTPSRVYGVVVNAWTHVFVRLQE